MSRSIIRTLALTLPLLTVVVIAAGCNRESQREKVVFDIVAPTQNEIAGSGTVRRVFGGPDGTTLIEKHTPYPDGTHGHVYYRTTSGTVHTAREDYRDGRQKSIATYAEDGKTLIHGEVYRPDGSLYLTLERLENGHERILMFGPDGHNFLHRDTDHKVMEDTYFRKNKTVWAKIRSKVSPTGGATEEWVDIYQANRSERWFRVEPQGFNQLVTYFNRSGTADYRQLWNRGFDQENYNNMLILGLDELDWQQNVARGLVFKEEKGVATLIESRHRVQSGTYPNVSTEIHVKKHRIDEKIERQVIEEWPETRTWLPKDQQKKVLQRLLHAGTVSEVSGPKGVIATPTAEEKVVETIDVKKLQRPEIAPFEEARSTFWRQDRGFLGHRDDTDPCRWYHK